MNTITRITEKKSLGFQAIAAAGMVLNFISPFFGIILSIVALVLERQLRQGKMSEVGWYALAGIVIGATILLCAYSLGIQAALDSSSSAIALL